MEQGQQSTDVAAAAAGGANAAAANPDALKIFISYSRRDMAAADAMVADLERNGFAVSIDRRDLPYGEEWQKELAGFIAASDTVVWLVSPDSVKSKWVNWELGEVGRLSKRLLPVRVREVDPATLPEALGRIHLLPAEGAYEAAAHEAALVKALNTDRAWLKKATTLSDDAREWLAKGRDSALLLRGRALAEAEAWSLKSPPDAPAPSSEVLELILASRRGQRNRLRYTVIGSVAAALVAIALSVYAFQQAQLASEKTVEATEGAARLAVNVAATELDQGRTDEAAVLLLEAARSFDEGSVSDDMLVALHRANQAYATTRIYGLPAGAFAYEGPDALYFVDAAERDVFRFDGDAPPALLLDGAPADAEIEAVGALRGGGMQALIVVRADGRVEGVRADGGRTDLGHLPPREEKQGRAYDVWGPEEITIHPSGMIATVTAYQDADGASGQYARLLHLPSGASLARAFEVNAEYLAGPGGREYLYIGGTLLFEEAGWFEIVRAGRQLTLRPATIGEAEFKALLLRTCILDGFGDPDLFPAAMATQIDTQSERRECRAFGEQVLYSHYQSTSAGIERGNILIRLDGGFEDLRDIMSRIGARPSGANLSWVGVDPRGHLIGAIQNRDLTIFSEYALDSQRAHADAPGPARFLGDGRIAVHEPWLNRVVVRALVNPPRATLDDPRQADVAGQTMKLDPLNPGSCTGYAFVNAYFGSTLRLPDGGEIDYAELIDEADPQTFVLRGADGASTTIALPAGARCAQFTRDGRRMTTLVPGENAVAIFDVDRLRQGAALDEARLPGPEGFFSSAFPIGAGERILTTSAERTVSIWSRSGGGEWTASTVYSGDNVVFHAEPDGDCGRLLLIESLGGGDTAGFLFSVKANKRWIDLGTDYKWFGLAFAADGVIASGARGVQSVIRLPTLRELAAETAGNLPERCRPSEPDDYRSSACWPAAL